MAGVQLLWDVCESGIAVPLCLIVLVVRREVCMIDTYLTRPPFLFRCSGA